MSQILDYEQFHPAKLQPNSKALCAVPGGASSLAGEPSGAGSQVKAQDIAAAMRMKAAGAAEGLAGRPDRQNIPPSRGIPKLHKSNESWP